MRKRDLILCTQCLEFSLFEKVHCENCGNYLIFRDHIHLLDKAKDAYFNGFVTRVRNERNFLLMKNPREWPQLFSIDPEDVYDFIVTYILPKIPYEIFKTIALKIYSNYFKKIQKNPPSDLEVRKIYDYLNSYREGLPDVRKEIKTEVLSYDELDIKIKRELLNELLKNIEMPKLEKSEDSDIDKYVI